MVWFTFTDDFNWRASKRGFVQYRAGQRVNVPRRCAEAAEAAGRGAREPVAAAAESAPAAASDGDVAAG